MGVGHPGGSAAQHLALGFVHVVDANVDVQLLGAGRIGELRWLVLW